MLKLAGGTILSTGFGGVMVYVNSALDPAASVLENVTVWGIGAIIIAFLLLQREVNRIMKGVDMISTLERRIVALETKAESVEGLLREFMEQHRVLLEQNGQNHKRR